MAKKKKIKNIDINSGELNPVTIGYLNNRKKGPFLLVIIFGILIAISYYMPEVTSFLNKYFNPTAYKEQQEMKKDYVIEEDGGKKKELTNDLTITVNKVKFTNFTLNGNILSYKINNATELENYYLSTYDEKKNLLETLPIPTIDTTSLMLTNVSIKYISIQVVEPKEEPKQVESQTVTCKKGNETYLYTFTGEGKLTNVSFTFELSKANITEAEYNTYQSKYKTEASGMAKEGLSVSMSSVNVNAIEGFIFTKEADLKLAKKEDINDENFQALDNLLDDVKRDMKNKGYICN